MLRFASATCGILLVAARICLLGVLGLGAVLCLGYWFYAFMRNGAFPDISLARLYPCVYEYLLPTRYVAWNTVYIFLVQLPLVILFPALLALAFLMDRLLCAVGRFLESFAQADHTS